jgi:hypothetical protein
MKMVLCHPGAIKPGPFGMYNLFGRQSVALLRTPLIQ